MSTLLEQEREKYQDIWSVEEYSKNSPGERLLPLFLRLSGAQPGASVLDAGCGSGKGAMALHGAGFAVTMADLTPEGLIDPAKDLPFVATCLWDDLAAQIPPHEWVYCCDVLEHLPTAFTMLAVSRLLACATRGVFLSIGTQPDTFGIWIGKTLHETVQPFVWWRDHLSAIAEIADSRDLLNSAIFLLTPKC